jgi:CheY-like chemotaxis protein
MILMDVFLSDINGFDATVTIRALESGTSSHVPIVGLTAHALKVDREHCVDAGMDDYLAKPISPDALLDKVEKWIGVGAGQLRSAG